MGSITLNLIRNGGDGKVTLISFPYFQEEQIKLGMIKVYSDRFCWKKGKNNEMLIVQMRMEDFISASEPVIIIILRASLCKILISSLAHKMDFAHNFSVDFF